MSSFRFGSHLPVLMRVTQLNDKPILELGSGIYSTVYLHWACFHKRRKLVTLEGKRKFYHEVKRLRCDWHDVRHVRNWDKEDIDKEWGVVLVDHSPGKRRAVDALRVLRADYVVIHDTENPHEYDYDKVYPHYKYRFDYKPQERHTPYTTVLSNIHDLKDLM